MSVRRVFIERLTESQAANGDCPTVIRVEGRDREKRLLLPDDEFLQAREARRLAQWILSHFKKA